MAGTHVATKSEAAGLSGRHVLMMMIGFFGLIFAVNGYFLYSALSTNTGLVANEPYRKGLAYNQRIAAEERQAALGWSHIIDLASDGKLAVRLTDKSGSAVAGLKLTAVVQRPATQTFDHNLQLAETAPGVYSAAAGNLESGNWVVSFEARRADGDADPSYRARRRLWLKP